jgi:hypothetical protein
MPRNNELIPSARQPRITTVVIPGGGGVKNAGLTKNKIVYAIDAIIEIEVSSIPAAKIKCIGFDEKQTIA